MIYNIINQKNKIKDPDNYLDDSKTDSESSQYLTNSIEKTANEAQTIYDRLDEVEKFLENNDGICGDEEIKTEVKSVKNSWRFLRHAATTVLAIVYIVGAVVGSVFMTICEAATHH